MAARLQTGQALTANYPGPGIYLWHVLMIGLCSSPVQVQASAERIASEGGKVVCVDMQQEAVQQVADGIVASGGEACAGGWRADDIGYCQVHRLWPII